MHVKTLLFIVAIGVPSAAIYFWTTSAMVTALVMSIPLSVVSIDGLCSAYPSLQKWKLRRQAANSPPSIVSQSRTTLLEISNANFRQSFCVVLASIITIAISITLWLYAALS